MPSRLRLTAASNNPKPPYRRISWKPPVTIVQLVTCTCHKRAGQLLARSLSFMAIADQSFMWAVMWQTVPKSLQKTMLLINAMHNIDRPISSS